MADLCEDGSPHCAHYTGLHKLLSPPLRVHVCCHCGEEGQERTEYRRVEGHGPYAPREVLACGGAIAWQGFKRPFDERGNPYPK